MRLHRPLHAALLALALGSSQPLLAQAADGTLPAARIDIAAFVREASQRFGIPEHWIHAVIRVESAGRIRAVSSAGAMGLMQLMPGTWARQRARYGLGSDPFDPRENILAGTSYLREMYDHYGAPGFLAAYNAGPGRYEEWRTGRRTLPLETRRYVARLAPLLQHERVLVAAVTQPRSTLDGTSGGSFGPASAAGEASRSDPPANPFAHPVPPSHDLFAPIAARDGP